MAEATVNAAGAKSATEQPATRSAQVLQTAAQTFSQEFGQGRSLKVRQPDLLAQFRLVEALGSELAKNEAYRDMAIPLTFLVELDGATIRAPMTKREIEALVARLGNEGYAALAKCISENLTPAPDSGDAEAQLKNS